MKTTLSFIACLSVAACTAQNSGTVNYVEKVKLDIHLDGPAAAMMDSLPKEQSSPMTLYFTSEESFYQPDKTAKSTGDIDKEQNGAHMVIKIDHPQNLIYRDLKNNKLIQQRDFMGRKFLVESDKGKSDWKMTGALKTILGYSCQEATRMDKDRKISAWFTSSIPVATGPATAGNLPGLILEENINDGKIIVTAVKIDLKSPDRSLIVQPKEGRKMSQEAFDKMVDEKMKEMDQDGGANQRQVIIHTK